MLPPDPRPFWGRLRMDAPRGPSTLPGALLVCVVSSLELCRHVAEQGAGVKPPAAAEVASWCLGGLPEPRRCRSSQMVLRAVSHLPWLLQHPALCRCDAVSGRGWTLP